MRLRALILGTVLASVLSAGAFAVQAASHPECPKLLPSEQGEYCYMKTDHGGVFIWKPANYTSGGTVIYVHGQSGRVEKVWRDHELAKQFSLSGVNAFFIVPDAPGSGAEAKEAAAPSSTYKYIWRSLPSLISTVQSKVAPTLSFDTGTLVVMGHSGAHQTIREWLGESNIDHLMLLDALFVRDEVGKKFSGWANGASDRRLTMTSTERTEKVTVKVAADIPGTLTLDKIPAEWSAEQYAAKSVYAKSQYGHNPIVTNQKVIPLFLLREPRLTGASLGAIEEEPVVETQSPQGQALAKGTPFAIFDPLGATSAQKVIGRVITQILGVVGGLALLFFVYGGVVWMTAAGNPDKVKKGKAIFFWAAVGLAFIFSAYAILNFILERLAD